MPEAGPGPVLHEARGVIQQVDVVGQALTLLVNGKARVFRVAAECVVLRHGRRVPLDMVRAADFAHVLYRPAPGADLATAVGVNSLFPRQATAGRVRRLPDDAKAPE